MTDTERLEEAYTLLISSTPSLYRSWIQSSNETAARLNELLHDKVIDWCQAYQQATGRGDQGLHRIGVAVSVAVDDPDAKSGDR